MGSLFADPLVVAFLVNYGAGVAWDATKASVKGMASFFRRPEGSEIARAFEGLRKEEQLRRAAQHLVNSVLKGLPEGQREQAGGDADMLADLVCKFLTEPQAGSPPITQQLRAAILGHVELPDGTDEQAIAGIAAAVVLAIARDETANLILLGAVEQVQSTVTAGFTEQSVVSNVLLSTLNTGLQDIKGQIGSSLSAVAVDPDAVAKHLAGQVNKLAALLNYVGVQPSDSTYVDARAALTPPQLPEGYVRRGAVLQQMAQMLEQRPIFAVTGYPECGKTLTLAEFASEDNECFWLDLPPTVSPGMEAIQLLCVTLACYLEAESASPAGIVAALDRYLAEDALLIVLDNAERLGEVDSLQFILDVAERANGRLRILMAYSETPGFTVAAKLARIPIWRLPGMEPHEAVELYQTLGVVVTKPRLIAVVMLCAQYEGHVGMLRLCRNEIAAIQADADVGRILTDASSKTTAADFKNL